MLARTSALLALSLTLMPVSWPSRADDAPAAHDPYTLGPNFVNGAYFLLRAEVERGLRDAPVKITFTDKTWTLVGLGSYLVNGTGGCNDCHTNPPFAPGGDPYKGEPKKINKAGYMAGGQHFGPFVSRNLTPENGLPAGRTMAEFKAIMRTGIDLDHAHPQISPLLQVMPWPSYQGLTDFELEAMYAYLSVIPPIAPSR